MQPSDREVPDSSYGTPSATSISVSYALSAWRLHGFPGAVRKLNPLEVALARPLLFGNRLGRATCPRFCTAEVADTQRALNTVRHSLRSEGPQRPNAYTATPYMAINASFASFSNSAVTSKFRVVKI